MSLHDAAAFLRRLEDDGDFAGRVEAARTADAFWALVAQEGFEFTRDEFVLAERQALQNALLDEAEAPILPLTPGAVGEIW